MNMKKQSIKGLAFIAVAGSLVTSCDLMKDLDYKITPNPLEMHGDSVRIKAEVTFPEKGIKKKASAELTPTFGGVALKPFTVIGEKATGNGTTIQYKPGGKVVYSDVIAYQPSFENAELVITGKVFKGGKEKKEIDPIVVAKGTIITPLLVNKDFKVIIASDEFKRVTEQKAIAQINFDKAKSNLKAAELNDKDIKDLQAWMTRAESNPKVKIKSINVVGYASPEGEQGKNESLSSDRATTGKNATLGLAKKAKNTSAQTEIYNLEGKGEDWEGFKTALQKSSMNEDEKQLVIRVLEMYKDPIQRETEIRNMSKTFTYLEKNILPALRRAEIHVVYDKTGYTDAELTAISKSKIDSLNLEEILFTATLTTDLNEKLRLYTAAERLFPSDYRTSNNVGAVLYMQGKLAEAKAKFEKANTTKENQVSQNNLGAIAGASGDRAKSKTLLAKAGSASETKYNQGILDIQDGNYAAAVSKLGDNNFNKALAQLLNGDAGAAIKTIDASADAESAQGYYLKAVASARQDKLEGIVNNLKSTFAKDGSMKAKALKDVEFHKYAENASFNAIVK
jgi:tetratricopeptide (TPR) repeat protein